MYIADTLSRAYLKGNNANTINDFEEILNTSEFEKEIESINMSDYLAVSEERKQKIRQTALEDDMLPKGDGTHTNWMG